MITTLIIGIIWTINGLTRLIQEIGPVYDPQSVFFFGPKKMRFMQIESVLQTKNRSEPEKNRFSVALIITNSPKLVLPMIRTFHDYILKIWLKLEKLRVI